MLDRNVKDKATLLGNQLNVLKLIKFVNITCVNISLFI